MFVLLIWFFPFSPVYCRKIKILLNWNENWGGWGGCMVKHYCCLMAVFWSFTVQWHFEMICKTWNNCMMFYMFIVMNIIVFIITFLLLLLLLPVHVILTERKKEKVFIVFVFVMFFSFPIANQTATRCEGHRPEVGHREMLTASEE